MTLYLPRSEARRRLLNAQWRPILNSSDQPSPRNLLSFLTFIFALFHLYNDTTHSILPQWLNCGWARGFLLRMSFLFYLGNCNEVQPEASLKLLQGNSSLVFTSDLCTSLHEGETLAWRHFGIQCNMKLREEII
ncbi:unnamed protein product [Vicia faba]|uniref:Uncharacterized protein n=1 Tax=Vicia faba TaxID=3906 RepID=A0AAV1AMG3_VICFA|nr:unnamed protein product [Vicia faba]